MQGSICCRERRTAIRASGPFRPRPVRPSASRTMPVFVGVWEPEVSQPLRRQSPPTPSRQTASPASLRFAPAPWWFRDSKAGTRIPDRIKSNDSARATVQPLRLQTTKAYKLTYAAVAVPHPPPYPARRGEKGYIYIHQGAAAEPLRVRLR